MNETELQALIDYILKDIKFIKRSSSGYRNLGTYGRGRINSHLGTLSMIRILTGKHISGAKR